MWYEARLVVPAQTPATSPAQREILIVPGTLTRVDVEFPRGCAGLVGARVFLGEQQLYPTNPDEWIRSDGQVVSFPARHDVVTEGTRLILKAYNTDDTYEHGPTIRASVLESSEVEIADEFAGTFPEDEEPL